VAPFGLGLLPGSNPLGRARNAALYWLARYVVFRDVHQHFARLAREGGWPAYPFEPTVSPYLYLQPTVPSFEYSRSDLPPTVHFIGPLLPETPADFDPPPWWHEVTESPRPVVLVTQGTIATNPRDLLLPALQGLAGEDVLVVGTTAGTGSDDLGAVPPNARLTAFVPFGRVMPYVSALVTNGGYGGVSMALAHGVPVVTAGSTEDKPEVGNRVMASGVGLRLKSSTPGPDVIRSAVRAVLDIPRYRARAQALQAEIGGYDAPRKAAALLDQLAQSGKPVMRSESL
jgi:UDP:flavonoid glycosyltransferase YjiC (YdhE family)